MEMLLEPVELIPPNKPPIPPISNMTDEWPNDEDLVRLRMIWTDQNYAGSCACSKCATFTYCYGMTYEKKICFPCFIEKNRPKPPKRKYTKRKKPSGE